MVIRFRLAIECENDGLKLPNGDVNRQELARILSELANDIEEGRDMKRTLRDVNGNTVGDCTIQRESR